MNGSDGCLLGTRYAELARNTIDYWMVPPDPSMTASRVVDALETAPVLDDATLRLYVHVPFCAQRCRFCAFSGGNSPDTTLAERYARLLVVQLRDLFERCPMRGRPIRSVNIGGGSPDLLGAHIDIVLSAIESLPGFSERTELGVELTLSTARPEFIETLCRHAVTKVSFGIQSLDPAVRGHMRQPKTLRHLGRVLEWLDGRIGVVNADLITGLPGQTLASVRSDLEELMREPRINCLSSYLLTPGAAPSLLAAVDSGRIPPMPSPVEQALMRLASYGAFRRAGWVRRGTNTYVDPRRVRNEALERMAGDECIGASHYEAFLLGIGPQAVSSLPGVRIENAVDIGDWCGAMERGDHPFCLPLCSTQHQRDLALWAFPLRWEGLPAARLERMIASGALSRAQLDMLRALEGEGLVHSRKGGYALSLLGEVFMGQLVRDLKQEPARRAIDEYISEGAALGRAIATGRMADNNRINNRQLHVL